MEHYRFSQTSRFPLIQNRARNYLFQLTDGRKLTDITHSHDFYEIVAVLSGECSHEINGEDVLAPVASCVILRPGDVHRFLYQTADTSILCLSVEVGEFDRLASCFDIGSMLRTMRPVSGELPADIFSEILRLSAAIRRSTDTAEPLMRLLLCTIFSEYASSMMYFEQRESGMISSLLRRMEEPENLREGVNAMLRLSGYSQSQLSRIVKNTAVSHCRNMYCRCGSSAHTGKSF